MKRFIYFIAVFLLVFAVHAQIGPLDCDDENPDIYPGQTEHCTDGLDNNCNIDESDVFDLNPNTGVDEKDINCCDFTVAWTDVNGNPITAAGQGQIVRATVTGTGACANQQVLFDLWEDDGTFGKDDISPDPSPATFPAAVPMVTFAEWTVVYLGGELDRSDETYASVRLDIPFQRQSGPFIRDTVPYLIVTLEPPPAECGDGNLDTGENCNNCPADAGCGNGFNCLEVSSRFQCLANGCQASQTLCNDGACQGTCGANFVCDNDKVCEPENFESCNCNDCNFLQDSCASGIVCNVAAMRCEADTDGDGVPNSRDNCQGTLSGEIVNSNGCTMTLQGCIEGETMCADGQCRTVCAPESSDACDNDNLCEPESKEGCGCGDCNRRQDSCQPGLVCSLTPKVCLPDSDSDSVPDSEDSCPDTARGAMVGSNGCPIKFCGTGVALPGQECPGTYCNANSLCESGESCLCGDCTGQTDSCVSGNACTNSFMCGCSTQSDGVCTSDVNCAESDPDCCSLKSAKWVPSCKVGDGYNVVLETLADNSCNGKLVNFEIKEADLTSDDIVDTAIVPAEVRGGKAQGSWAAEYRATCGGGSCETVGNPTYYFNAKSGLGSVKSSDPLLEVKPCDLNDADCDGILDDADLCITSDPCLPPDQQGCGAGQSSCVVQWDCTTAVWSECNEDTGKITRDTNLCTFTGSDQSCNTVLTRSTIPNERNCLTEEAFPVFNWLNVVMVVILLMGYYFVRDNRKK